jgi:hypothetical protein
MTHKSHEPTPDPDVAPQAAPEAKPLSGLTAVDAGEPVRVRPGLPPSDEDQIESGFDNMPV